MDALRKLGTLFLAAALACAGCGGDGGGAKESATATPAITATPTATPPGPPDTVPDFAAATFSDPTRIDNAYFPLVPETVRIYLTELGDGYETDVVEVLDEQRQVMGIAARVVRDRVFEAELLSEDTHDWFAQDDAGNVWYLGEEVDNYEYDDDDEVIEINHDGAWEAGLDVADLGVIARPGYQMEAAPSPGDVYHQEYYPGVAEDMAEVLATGVVVTLADGSEYSTLRTRDFTPLEPDVEELKYYAAGVGTVLEEDRTEGERTELKGVFQTGAESIPSFAAATFSHPTRIDNPLLPWTPGAVYTYEAETEDGVETIVVEVLEETRVVNGIETVTVRDRVSLGDLLIEDTRDWYAQDDAGNVWYLGEDVDNYNYDDEDDLVDVTHEGSWEAGRDVAGLGVNAVAGIVMQADPQAGQSYRQEYYPGGAEDLAYVVRRDATLEVDGEAFCEGCLQILEWNPLEPAVLEYKFYRAGTGLVAEQKLGSDELVLPREPD
jgi:hypothetical protein